MSIASLKTKAVALSARLRGRGASLGLATIAGVAVVSDQMFAATATSSGVVTLESGDISGLQTGVTNGAASFLDIAVKLAPIVIPVVVVFLVVKLITRTTHMR